MAFITFCNLASMVLSNQAVRISILVEKVINAMFFMLCVIYSQNILVTFHYQ